MIFSNLISKKRDGFNLKKSDVKLFFNDVEIPVENMLGEREGGFKIALNVLNIGRIKLGAGVLGGCRAVSYTHQTLQTKA